MWKQVTSQLHRGQIVVHFEKYDPYKRRIMPALAFNWAKSCGPITSRVQGRCWFDMLPWYNEADRRYSDADNKLYVTVTSRMPQDGHDAEDLVFEWHTRFEKRPTFWELEMFGQYMEQFETFMKKNFKLTLTGSYRPEDFYDPSVFAVRVHKALSACFDHWQPRSSYTVVEACKYDSAPKLFEAIQQKTSHELKEKVGLRDMLEVLWVSLPYLQPDGDLDEWKAEITMGEEGEDSCDVLVMTLSSGDLALLFKTDE